MADEGFKRKLAAILSADVEGYSRLMDDDEEATVRTLTKYRSAINDLVQQYRGRVVDTPGDNILAEFTSVVDAVNCAVEIQRELAERNAELLYNRKMVFRIGVNLGDVIDEEGRIYGDGVNIAARVEAMAEAGAICISGRAYDQVENKLGLEYENLGEHQVKNITRPIRVYRVLSFPGAAAHRVVKAKEAVTKKWRNLTISAGVAVVIVALAAVGWQYYQSESKRVEAASIENMAYPLPDNPSIAVLPFTNMSGDPEQDYLGDAISENIISALSMFPDLLVIARNSTFVYKNKPVKIKQLSEELGVQYVLEGSVMKSGDQLRITAQLIDALTGHHKWSRRYDRKTQDVLYVLDEITMAVCAEIDVKLGSGGGARLFHKGTDNFKAWECVIRSIGHLRLLSRKNNKAAHELLERAISIDPEYSVAWSYLAIAHLNDTRYGWSQSKADSKKRGVECIKKALSLDESNFIAYNQMGRFYEIQRKFDLAIAEYEKANSLAPGDSWANYFLSHAFRYACRPEEALLYGKKALRLAPNAPWYFFSNIGYAHYWLGQYEDAIYWFEQVLDRCQKGECKPKYPHTYLAMAYSEYGQMEKARTHMQKLLEYNPKFNLEDRRKSWYYKDPAYTDRAIMALRKAGAPERPPSQ